MGLGFDSFSASASMVPELKFFARRFNREDIQKITTDSEKKKRPSEVKQLIKDFHEARVSEASVAQS